jgi:hypothetical protein
MAETHARGGGPSSNGPRGGAAALLAALLLLGGIESHAASEAHDPVAGLAGLAGHGEVFFPGASHPVAPLHTEEAAATQRPLCAVCLKLLEGNGAPTAPAARLPAPLAARPLSAGGGVAPRRPPRAASGARAPPRA